MQDYTKVGQDAVQELIDKLLEFEPAPEGHVWVNNPIEYHVLVGEERLLIHTTDRWTLEKETR